MLELISFVGVDTKTDLERLAALNRDSPIPLEFGVLSSLKRNVQRSRYPSYAECLNLLIKLESYDIISSLHLCGSEAIDGFLNDDKEILTLANRACRVQLNLNVQNYDINELADRLIAISNHRTLIIQENKSKHEFIKLIKSKVKLLENSRCSDRFNFLFDASDGIGKPIEKFEPFDEDFFTGYAGGIDTKNVLEIYNTVESVNKFKDIYANGYPIGYYLDMESGIRTDDWFDLEKCSSIIKSLTYHLSL